MSLDPQLLAILVCPKCKQPVEPNSDQSQLICRACRLAYLVKDDIPIMLVDEAQPLED